MYKLWTIISNEIFQIYSDRNALLILLLTPLAVASLIGFAFSDVAGETIGISNIPVALVNHDQAVDQGEQRIAMGESFTKVFVPPADATEQELLDNEVWRLTDAVLLADEREARAGVDDGRYVAALIIPSDFSANMSQLYTTFESHPSTIELYANAESPVLAAIVEAIATSVATRMNAGSIAISSSIGSLIELSASDPELALQLQQADELGLFEQDFSQAFSQEDQIRFERQDISGNVARFNPFMMFGAGQAVFFMMFTAMATMNSILRERREGLLARQLATPTDPGLVLLARMLSSVCICFVQVGMLLCAMNVIGSLFEGRWSWMYGNAIGLLIVTVLAIAWAASGFASIVTSLARTPEQGNVIGGVITIAMGMLGGAFFNVSSLGELELVRFLSVNYWGVSALIQLAQGENAVQSHLLVLTVLGTTTFVAGFLIFRKRLEA